MKQKPKQGKLKPTELVRVKPMPFKDALFDMSQRKSKFIQKASKVPIF